MPDAIHTARWISQLSETNWDMHLFSSRPGEPIDEMPAVTHHTLFPTPAALKTTALKNSPLIPWSLRGKNAALKAIQLGIRQLSSVAGQLALVINRIKPDIVHTLEMQTAGYLMLEALPFIKKRQSFKWVYSCWGNDLLFYQNKPDHRERIARVLQEVDFYTADCARDIREINTYFPRGNALPVFPTGGGYDVENIHHRFKPPPPSKRRIIALKGYHSDCFTGRAVNALRALELCKQYIKSYQIVIYRPGTRTLHVAQYLAQFSEMNITCLDPWLPNDRIMQLLGESRVAISTNSGDGTPNAMLEAMIMGAFPIQSSTADTDGWIEHGRNGFVVPYDDIPKIAEAIKAACSDDDLVDQSARFSNEIVSAKLDRRLIAKAVIAAYEQVLRA